MESGGLRRPKARAFSPKRSGTQWSIAASRSSFAVNRVPRLPFALRLGVAGEHAQKQLGFFDRDPIAFDTSLPHMVREHIGNGAWLDYAPHAVAGNVQLFEELVSSTRWHEASQQMYDKTVQMPRLYAVLPEDGF